MIMKKIWANMISTKKKCLFEFYGKLKLLHCINYLMFSFLVQLCKIKKNKLIHSYQLNNIFIMCVWFRTINSCKVSSFKYVVLKAKDIRYNIKWNKIVCFYWVKHYYKQMALKYVLCCASLNESKHFQNNPV